MPDDTWQIECLDYLHPEGAFVFEHFKVLQPNRYNKNSIKRERPD
jgi:hypothetical protein